MKNVGVSLLIKDIGWWSSDERRVGGDRHTILFRAECLRYASQNTVATINTVTLYRVWGQTWGEQTWGRDGHQWGGTDIGGGGGTWGGDGHEGWTDIENEGAHCAPKF